MKIIDWKYQPDEICADCGIEANRLTCLQKYGQEPIKKAFEMSTYHEGICDICHEKKWCTQARDFFYPDFNLLKNAKNKKNTTPLLNCKNVDFRTPRRRNKKSNGIGNDIQK